MLYRCSHCRQMLAEKQFPPSALARRDYRCLACFRDVNRAYRKANAEQVRKFARERMRKWREHNPGKGSKENPEKARQRAQQYANANREKKRAHSLVQRAIKSGRLIRQPCEACGSTNAHAHHDDYTKPLQVRWLCAKDHVREHRWVN